MPTAVRATATYLPPSAVSNEDLAERLIAGSGPDLRHDERELVRARARGLERKTGLVERRFFAAADDPVAIAYGVLGDLVAGAGARWDELDGIVVSSSRSHGFPGVSQRRVARARSEHVGLGDPFVLDLGSNACTGFMYAVGIASSLIATQGYRNVAVLAVEFSSRCLDYRASAFASSMLFGDAVSGLLLAAGGNARAELLSVHMGSRIDAERITHIRGAGVTAFAPDEPAPASERWFVDGPPVARGAIDILVAEVQRYQRAGVDVDWLIPHQANLTRILHPACDAVGVPRERLCTSFAHTGNTSSASIPLLLDDLLASGRAKSGDDVILVGFGASYSTGSAHLRVA